jgi:hypothetical protein
MVNLAARLRPLSKGVDILHTSRFFSSVIILTTMACDVRAVEDVVRHPILVERVIDIADTALGYPKDRPESVELVTAKFLPYARKKELSLEGVALETEIFNSRVKGKGIWIVKYQKVPLRLGDGITVLVDAFSGAVITVSRAP